MRLRLKFLDGTPDTLYGARGAGAAQSPFRNKRTATEEGGGEITDCCVSCLMSEGILFAESPAKTKNNPLSWTGVRREERSRLHVSIKENLSIFFVRESKNRRFTDVVAIPSTHRPPNLNSITSIILIEPTLCPWTR